MAEFLQASWVDTGLKRHSKMLDFQLVSGRCSGAHVQEHSSLALAQVLLHTVEGANYPEMKVWNSPWLPALPSCGSYLFRQEAEGLSSAHKDCSPPTHKPSRKAAPARAKGRALTRAPSDPGARTVASAHPGQGFRCVQLKVSIRKFLCQESQRSAGN